MRPFLSARWENLALLNYAVDDSVLAPHLPPGCEIDRYRGQAYVSLVAFDFVDTRVKGVRWPGFVSFPEVNLRFYVRHGERRGVVFIRELVPQRLVAWLARALYNEPYRAVAMTSATTTTATGCTVEHHVQGSRLRISGGPRSRPGEDSLEHFFKEHQWGFGRTRGGALLVYEVRHPIWDVYAGPDLELSWDFAAMYGDSWRSLNDREPDSVVFAVGSPIEVYP